MSFYKYEDYMILAQQALEAKLEEDPELRPVFEAQRHALDLLDKIIFKRYLKEFDLE